MGRCYGKICVMKLSLWSDSLRLALTVGLCGGFTTFRYFGSQTWPFPSDIMVGFRADASKCAFAYFASIMFDKGLPWIDCQVYTDHLARFGAKDIPRAEYLLMLRDALKTH